MRHGDKALVALVAACALTACSASHETARRVATTDSLLAESRWRLSTTTVPESRVELAIPVATLRTLPATGLADHQGQATARVRWRHDTLYVAATCDSLQRLVLEYEGQLRHVAALRESTKEKGARPLGWPNRGGAPPVIGGTLIGRTRRDSRHHNASWGTCPTPRSRP